MRATLLGNSAGLSDTTCTRPRRAGALWAAGAPASPLCPRGRMRGGFRVRGGAGAVGLGMEDGFAPLQLAVLGAALAAAALILVRRGVGGLRAGLSAPREARPRLLSCAAGCAVSLVALRPPSLDPAFLSGIPRPSLPRRFLVWSAVCLRTESHVHLSALGLPSGSLWPPCPAPCPSRLWDLAGLQPRARAGTPSPRAERTNPTSSAGIPSGARPVLPSVCGRRVPE